MLDGHFEKEGSALKLSDLVFAKITERIRSGEYVVDARLPTENELSEELGVSRPVVREALARLRNDGVVVSRRGSGTYVLRTHDISEPTHPPLTSINDMRKCLEYRISVEGETAYHAALGRPEDRTALIEAAARFDSDLEARVFTAETDFAFHNAVARATGNRFFWETMEGMRSSIMTAMSITPNFQKARSYDRIEKIHAEHKAIFDAIMANDGPGAREAMRNHLNRAMIRVFEGD
jgi:GntR family transcriptional regulator, transcriptional repressor for pyruvate dehydrogenase complex